MVEFRLTRKRNLFSIIINPDNIHPCKISRDTHTLFSMLESKVIECQILLK